MIKMKMTSLSYPALKPFTDPASLAFCGNSFQIVITLFRKYSFQDLYILPGSLRKKNTAYSKVSCSWTMLVSLNSLFRYSFPFDMVQTIQNFIELNDIASFSHGFESRQP